MTCVQRAELVAVHVCPVPMREVVYQLPTQLIANGKTFEHREQVPDGPRPPVAMR
jgi:hypothetical protein